jgi:hypothetical protein
MKRSIEMLKAGFQSSSTATPEFNKFFRTFKSEFSKELMSINGSAIVFNKGHFYISGFFMIDLETWYFSLPDVRHMGYGMFTYPDSSMNKLLYRTARDYKDYIGGHNRYTKIETGMAENMCWSFKVE